MFRSSLNRILLIGILCLGLSACVGTVVGAVVDTTIEVAKIPFKVGGAIIDVATPDNDSSELNLSGDRLQYHQEHREQAADKEQRL